MDNYLRAATLGKCGVAQLTIPTQSQYTDTGPTSRITVPIRRASSGQLIHCQFFRVWLHAASGFEPPTYRSLGGRSTNEPQRPVLILLIVPCHFALENNASTGLPSISYCDWMRIVSYTLAQRISMTAHNFFLICSRSRNWSRSCFFRLEPEPQSKLCGSSSLEKTQMADH